MVLIASTSMRLAKTHILSFFRKDVHGLHTSFCHGLPGDVADVIINFRELLLRVLEHPALAQNETLHNEVRDVVWLSSTVPRLRRRRTHPHTHTHTHTHMQSPQSRINTVARDRRLLAHPLPL
jgi:hypothetical protein